MSKTAVKVDGVSFWACVHKPGKESGAYSIDLVVDDANRKVLEEAGLSPAQRKTGELVEYEEFPGQVVFRFKRSATLKDGTRFDPPTVYDSAGNVTSKLIGNGSRVRVYGTAFEYTFKGKSGISGGLNKVQIIELKELDVVDVIDGGYIDDSVLIKTALPNVDNMEVI